MMYVVMKNDGLFYNKARWYDFYTKICMLCTLICIAIRSNKFDFLNDIITKEMIFITETAKHGSIYKTPDRKTTVTMYKSTSCMHVQGSNYWLWTKEFVKSIKSKLEDRSQNSALEDSCAYNPPQMTSTPKRNDQKPRLGTIRAGMRANLIAV